jgi:phosphoribosyl-ATP pyrophosphohydrolase
MSKAAKKRVAPVKTLKARKPAKRRSPAKTATVIDEDIPFDPAAQLDRARSAKPRALSHALNVHAEPDVLNRLWSIIETRRAAHPAVSHSARLLGRGVAKVAQKFGEEAVECLIEIVAGNRKSAIAESADVLYHLLVCWVEAGIRPEEA